MMKKTTAEESMHEPTVDDIVNDLKAVVRDAEALLHATEGHAGERIAEIRDRAKESLDSAKQRLHNAGANVGEHARTAARSADTYVRENPWTAIAVAVGVGFLLGAVSRRR